MLITLVRHGQTEYNRQNRMQGSQNIPLNDEGRREARKIKEQIDQENYDICFSSPLIRTMETAMILVGDKVEIIRDDRLKERDLGELEGKERKDYDVKKYWDYDKNSGDKQVEKVKDVFERAESFLEDLEKKYKDKKILIVSHGAMIRAMHHILHHTDRKRDLTKIKIKNCYIETIKK